MCPSNSMTIKLQLMINLEDDGIFILTSNRVGTFDESFKSRIQLALHYPVLTESDRRKIWRNFVRMLSKPQVIPQNSPVFSPNPANSIMALNVNIEDLEDHLEDLAKHPLNGRQIRNAVTTAKKLAMYLKQTLDFTHFERVIDVCASFDRSLEETHGHSDDTWARQERLR
jgi:ribosomal protein S15P/S13E